MANRIKNFIVIFLVVTNISLYGQNWHWEWVQTNNKNGADAAYGVLHTDFLNNVYCRTAYDTVIYFPDTSFHHPEQYNMNANSVISKYNDRGTFINALDLYTFPGSVPIDPQLVTDSLLNIYLSSELFNIVHIKDTLLTATTLGHPDVFIAKLTPNYDLVWSGLITSGAQDDLRGMVISDDDFIYLSCIHYANYYPEQLNYLNQDTSAPYITPMNTLAKIGPNGNLVWKKEIRSEFLGTDTRDLIIGDDGLLYLTGSALGHISVDSDTIYHPFYPEIKMARFLTIFSQEGDLIDGYFFDWDIWLWEIKADSESNLYVSGLIQDTAVIGVDTIIVPEGDYYELVGKFDQELNPIWYHVLKDNTIVRLFLDNKNVLFTTTAEGTCQIADTTLELGYYYETIIGEFNENGELINIINTNSSQELTSWFNLTDNCTNIMLGGAFKGLAVFGNDTVFSNYSFVKDGFVARLARNEPALVDLGPDSSYCKEYTLYGPEGYQFYSWNDSIINQNWYTINESETVYFGCSNENGCWSYDTINIDIHPGIEFELGNDTTIKENDTIIITVPGNFESYLWFDGTTGNIDTIIAANYGIGTLSVWVQITDGPCVKTDTLLLHIKSVGIEEFKNKTINIYPNPFEDKITIEIKPNYQFIEVIDLNGVRLLKKNLNQSENSVELNLNNLTKGVYFIKIQTKDRNLIRKIVKI